MNFASCDLLEANLLRVVRGLREREGQPPSALTVVVVDNFTSVAERAAVEQLGLDHEIEVVPIETNVGFGAGVNHGVAHAIGCGADVIVVLNPDAWTDADSVWGLVRHVLLHPRDLVGPVVYRPDSSVWSSAMDVYLSIGQLRASSRRPPELPSSDVLGWISGACFAIGRQLWLDTGGFDEEYFMYWEDVDLSWRVEMLGGRSIVVQDSSAFHDESGTQRHEGHRSPLFYYYNTRNRLLFASKHLSEAQQRSWKRHSRANIRRMVRPEGLRALRPPWGSLRALLAGELDGRRGLRGRQGSS